MKNKKSSLSFFQKIVLVLVGIILSYPPSPAHAQRSKLNKTELEFGNGSGWLATTVGESVALQVKTPLMFSNGLTENDIFDELITSFYTEPTSDKEFLKEIKENLLGMIAPFAYIPSVSSRWIVCNGQILHSSSHQQLANLIKDTYGGTGVIADGEYHGTFQVPDLRGLFIRGATSNAEVGIINETTNIPSHNHRAWTSTVVNLTTVSGYSHTHQNNPNLFIKNGRIEENDANANFPQSNVITNDVNPNSTPHYHRTGTITFTLGNVIEPTGENRPPNAAIIYCIYSPDTEPI